MPFRPGHGWVHQSPRIDEDTAEQWPCCGPINSLRLWHLCLTLASGNENYSSDSLTFFSYREALQQNKPSCHCSRGFSHEVTFKILQIAPMPACPWATMIAF